MNAALYMRVSLEAQRLRLLAYCTLMGLEPVAILTEQGKLDDAGKGRGVSARKIPLHLRPEGARLVDLIQRKQVAHVVAYKLDRLFRNTIDCLQTVQAWDKQGVSLHLVDMGGMTLNTGSAMGRMVMTMAAAIAELEAGLASERTIMALTHLKSQGVRLGRPSAVPEGVVSNILTMRRGGASYRAIAECLTQSQHPTPEGKETWGESTVRAVIRRNQ